MKIGRLSVACALVSTLLAPSAAQARLVIEGSATVAKKLHVDLQRHAAKSRKDEGFIWPLEGLITTHFEGDHNGIDIDGEPGDKILAARGGRVTFAGDDGDGYGLKILIRHAGGYETLYSHLSSFEVSKGRVEAGEVIGYVGCTGSCTGDHLHFEILHKGDLEDPLDLLK